MSRLAKLLDRHVLRQMAGERSFERGEEYFSDGSVRSLAEHAGTITAKVLGTRPYKVKLWVKDGGLEYACTCPVGAEGGFCKHCVATGLAWLKPPKASNEPRNRSVTMKDVRSTLSSQSKEALVKLVMDRAMDDDRLRQRLLIKAATRGRKRINVATYRNAIDQAVDNDGFVGYREAYAYAEGISDVIDSIQDLLKQGHAEEVFELTEHGLSAVEEALNSVDDSGGNVGDLLERLQELHLAACRKARPDPDKLAARLFRWEMDTDWDTFHGASETYAKVLGERGLAVYRKLAEEAWSRVPSREPGSEGYSKNSRITHIMETLARQTGDVEAVVAVKRRDLSSSYAYLQVAETYKRARKYSLALQWAEKGVKAFHEKADSRLLEFLAEEYHRRRRHGDAMPLIWSNYADEPDLSGYQKLKAHADRGGQWLQWREKALAFLRESVAKEKAAARKSVLGWSTPADHSDLVSIYLWEKDVESAWREAKAGGCSDELWLKLASLREAQHPADAVSVYQTQVESALGQKNDLGYRHAVELLRKIRSLMTRPGREAEFGRYLESVRAAHKPKRNFIKMLDRALPA
ncbi:MAG TPA: hypothetical protein DCZ01_05360 [Elusimicrobia bacterium]|nr:hypothetical protein [Elusimicrobiota bacterium]